MQRMPPMMKTPSSPSPRGDGFSPPPSFKDEKEKTIPFLRQLTEMLQNNEELISFVPGQRLPHETIQGKIIVHDRNRVQSEVLPIYFNHASFASLRRQLSYFSFVRVGKSRQSGVTYTNDAVVDLVDILKLKRRTARQAAGAVKLQQQQAGQLNKRPNKQQQPRPHVQAAVPKHPQEIQQQQQQQQQEQRPPLPTTSADVDVASAVLSGTLHAAKTNHNLDTNNNSSSGSGNNSPINSPTTPSPLRTSPAACQSSSTTNTQSSISQSISRSSSSSSDNASNTKGSSNDINNNNDNNINNDNNDNRNNIGCSSNSKSLSKVYVKRKAHPSFPKHPIPRKDRARLDKLLSMNNIVPFIHLPALSRRNNTMRREGSIATTTNRGNNNNNNTSIANTNTTNNGGVVGESERKARSYHQAQMLNQHHHHHHHQKENTPKVDTARERGLSTDGAGAIRALLALGATQ